MEGRRRRVDTEACPTPEILTAFTLGEPFELATAAEIATHIDICKPCTTFVGAVVDKVLEWSAPEAREGDPAPAHEEEIEASWQDFWERHGEALGAPREE